MDIDLAALPDDVKTLQRMVRSLAAERTTLSAAQAEIERLHLIIKKLQRSQFGRRAERLDQDQMQLGFEDLGGDIARVEATLPHAPAQAAKTKSQIERPSLPAHLPREEMRIDIAQQACPCCGGELHRIGETVSEMLDHVPARLRVIRICRPRYGCRACGTIHQAPAPERPIAKGMATPSLLAHILVSKYCDHLPLYRQSQIFARQGVELDRSTLANWVGGAVWWLEPLQARLAEHVFASQTLFADDTPIPVLDPGRGRTKTGRLWVYARDDRPWCGPEPPAAVYLYSPDRRAERPISHLAKFNRVPPRGGVADAIRYALTRWSALCRFLDDGRIELDNNTVERAIRPIALGRKNHLFAGSDGGAARWAAVASLLATAKLNNVEPFAYLREVLERLSNGHPMSRLDDLLPWNWAPPAAAAA
jgi:transposase